MRYSEVIEKVTVLFESVIQDLGDDVNQILENDYSYETENFIVERMNKGLEALGLSQDDLLRLFLQDWNGIAVIDQTLNGADMISQSVVSGCILDSGSLHKILNENSEILSAGWGWPVRFLSNSNCDEQILEILAQALIDSGNTEYLELVVSHSSASQAVIDRYSNN